jgi:sugar lactone lactonase YvrE
VKIELNMRSSSVPSVSRNTQHATRIFWSIVLLLFLAPLPALRSQPLTFTTLSGYAGDRSADGTNQSALFSEPQFVAVDSAGKVYVADSGNHTIRVLTAAGASSTLAGTAGAAGSADGTGSAALFNQPAGIAVDGATNVYVADYGNHTIRQITPAGLVTTIAGSPGVTGSLNATGTNALFFHPMGLALDSAGNIYVADYGNHLIRKISPSRAVTTLAGSAGVFGYTNGTGTSALFYGPEAVTVDSAGNVFVADTGNAAIRKITSGGVVSLLAGSPGSSGSADGTGTNALFFQPAGITINSSNKLYVADYFNQTIRSVTTAGVVTTLAGAPGGAGSANGSNGNARFWGPQGLAVNNAGTIYVADVANGAIRAMTAAGVVSTFAGSPSAGSTNGLASVARFYSPQSVATDNSGNLYIADAQNSTIRKISPQGTVSTLAGTAGVFGSADGANAQFSGPQGVTVDASGNVYVADTGNNTIRKVTSAGVVSTLAGTAGTPGNADGTGINARFWAPQGITLDRANNIYVADTWNHTIRKITSGGVVSTLAGLAGAFGSFDGAGSNARFNCPVGIVANQAGDLFVTDYNNDTIRRVSASGMVSTLAGGAGLWGSTDGVAGAARFFGPSGITLDSFMNLFVTDSGNHTIRFVSAVGTNSLVGTIAGLPGVSGTADGKGNDARFCNPESVAMNNGSATIYVVDAGNNTIRAGAFTSSNNAPLLLTQPQPQTVSQGQSARFAVSAWGAVPLAFQWRKDGVTIPGATDAAYSRTNVHLADQGNYSVSVTNQYGVVFSSNAFLTLAGAVVITSQPQNQVVPAGANALFSIAATGDLPLTFQWRFNGVNIGGATSTSLSVNFVQDSNAGPYSVAVSNVYGAVVSSNAILLISRTFACGDNSFGEISMPFGLTNLIALAAGGWHSLALRSDGSLAAWGDNGNGQCNVPLGLSDAIAIAGGGYHSLAIRSSGSVAAWGANDYGQSTVAPAATNVIAIAAGDWHSLALNADGSVLAWGDDSSGQIDVPSAASDIVSVAAGGSHSLALKADGTVLGWGDNANADGFFVGQSIVPSGLSNVVAIAAGAYHSLALKSNGQVVCWGDDSFGQCDVSAGLSAVAISAGAVHTLALRSNGTVVAWGDNTYSQINPSFSTLSNVLAVVGGNAHTLLLLDEALPSPQLFHPSFHRFPNAFSALVPTYNRKTYVLESSGSLAASNWTALSTNTGNGALRLLVVPNANAPQGFYRVKRQ